MNSIPSNILRTFSSKISHRKSFPPSGHNFAPASIYPSNTYSRLTRKPSLNIETRTLALSPTSPHPLTATSAPCIYRQNPLRQ